LAAIDQAERSRELARRRRERWIILVTLVVVAAVTYLETHVVELAGDQPLSSSILVFALININALLLLLLIFLVFRNLVKLLMERRGRVLGSKLRTKLVVAFVLLTLVPTGTAFFRGLPVRGYFYRVLVSSQGGALLVQRPGDQRVLQQIPG
jgi:two-component system nitrogen regulation sensor histidine kinase NtrY